LQGQKLLAVWAKRSDVAKLIETMLNAGQEPQVITCTPFHWQALLPETADGNIALTDGAALAVYSDREPIYIRSLGEDEPAREIETTLAAVEFGKGIKVRQVFLIGSAALAGDFTLAGTEGEETPVVRLAVNGKLAEAFGTNSPKAFEHAGAWSLAQENIAGDTVNFRHGELAYTAGFERIKKKLLLTAILAAAFVLLLFVETGIRYYMVKKDLDSINASIRGMYKEIFTGRKKPVDEVAEIRSEIKRMGGGTATRDLLGTLKKIAELKNDGIHGFYETEIDGNMLRLKGDAASFQAVNDFKARAGAQFTAAEVAEIKSRPDGSVSFTFRGTLQEGSK
jgi:general secretion pathway protein L